MGISVYLQGCSCMGVVLAQPQISWLGTSVDVVGEGGSG